MKSIKKVVLVFLVICVILFGLMGNSYATTLKLAYIYAATTPVGLGAGKFVELVKEKSGGEIIINDYPGSQLGTQPEIFASMKLGTIDLTYASMTTYGWVSSGKALQIASLPYLFNSADEATIIFESELFQDIYDNLEREGGIKILKIGGQRSPRGINTKNTPVWNPEDIKGISMRVSQNPMLIELFKALGANPIPIAVNELFLAIQQNIVTAQDNGVDFIIPLSLQEVTNYYAQTDHVFDIAVYGVSTISWEKLSQEEKNILSEAAEEAAEWQVDYFRRNLAKEVEKLIQLGMKFTIPNKQAFADMSKDVYKKFEGDVWPEGLVGKIREMQEQMRAKEAGIKSL